MRCQYLITGLLVLLAPLASANPAAASSGTTTSTSTTTITRTVVRATQTSTVKGESPSASATSEAVASIGNGVMGAQGTGIVQPSKTGSAYGSETSLPAYSYLGAASTERGNWNVAVMVGSLAVVLGYAL